jgi:hypothetical protein
MKKNKTHAKVDKPVATVNGERFMPEVGWLVSNTNANVFLDPVVQITEFGFICKSTGLWTGTTAGWLAHNNIKPKEEN